MGSRRGRPGARRGRLCRQKMRPMQSQTTKLWTVLWSPEKKEWVVADYPDKCLGMGWAKYDNYFHAHAEAARRNSLRETGRP